jgi:hypothetical protein
MAEPPDSPDRFDRTEPGGNPSLASSSETEAARASETQQTSPPPNVAPPPSQVSPSRASVPPSEPRSTSRASFSQIDLQGDRPARLQMIVALLLGLVLVAIPLYLWRRPRAESIAATGSADAGTDPAPPAATTPADDAKPTLGEPKSVLCQDPGPKKTAPEQCDHVVEVEKAFAKAIEESASCVPKDAGGGTIQYIADVSFKKKALNVAVPKEGRTFKNAKVVSACHAAVKSKLQSLSLDPIAHTHARYKIAITASYPGSVK